MNITKLENHVRHLQEKHDILDRDIHDKYSHYEPDHSVEMLKKEKLHLKDEIENLQIKIEALRNESSHNH